MTPMSPCGCNCSAPGKEGGCYHYIAGPPLKCLCKCHPDSAAANEAAAASFGMKRTTRLAKEATEREEVWRAGYKEGISDGACIETCGNLLRHIVEHCDALFVEGVLDADRSEKEMDLCGLLAGARSNGPCERCTPGIEPIPDVHDVTKTMGYRAGVDAALAILRAEYARARGDEATAAAGEAFEAVAKLVTWETS